MLTLSSAYYRRPSQSLWFNSIDSLCTRSLSSSIVFGGLWKILSLMYRQRKKSGGVKSRLLGGQFGREIGLSLKNSCKKAIVSVAVCVVALFCWNQQKCSCGSKEVIKSSVICRYVPHWRSLWKKWPDDTPSWYCTSYSNFLWMEAGFNESVRVLTPPNWKIFWVHISTEMNPSFVSEKNVI